jgi:hypothetical protein
MHVASAHGSGVRPSGSANSCTLPAWTRSLTAAVVKIIPRIFRIMDTLAVTARTVQGMARVRSGQAPAVRPELTHPLGAARADPALYKGVAARRPANGPALFRWSKPLWRTTNRAR